MGSFCGSQERLSLTTGWGSLSALRDLDARPPTCRQYASRSTRWPKPTSLGNRRRTVFQYSPDTTAIRGARKVGTWPRWFHTPPLSSWLCCRGENRTLPDIGPWHMRTLKQTWGGHIGSRTLPQPEPTLSRIRNVQSPCHQAKEALI